MNFIAFILSLFIAALGVLGMVSPMRLLNIVRHFQSPAGIYAAAALRIILGVALFLVAPTSRAPEIVRIVGIITLVAGLITPLFGLERFRRLIDWWSARGPAFMRIWAGFALAFGLLLAYTVAP
jgi:membrane-bound ClpP family serine protease